MFGKRISLFKLFGFEVRADASWFLILALITWTLATNIFRFRYPGLQLRDYWIMGFLGAIGLFASVVVHELFHSLVARRYGLNMKGITLFIFGGVAEMEEEPPNAKSEFLMAIAGPAASIVIGILFYSIYAGLNSILPVQSLAVLSYLYWINWVLAAFNLIPAFPLDGGRVLRSALWWHWRGDLPKATRIAASIGSGFGILLIALSIFRLLRGDFVGAIWWFLIGMFLRSASQASYQQVMMRTVLAGESIERFMKTNPVTVPPELPVAGFVEDYIYKYHHKMYPVLADSNYLVGCVTVEQVKNLPRSEWQSKTVQEILQPCSPENTIAPEADAQQVLVRMTKTGRGRLMVTRGDQLLGIIALKDLLKFFSTKLEIEGSSPMDRPKL
jgi:Zn-dependent protease/CBS domain-containing protein